MNEREMKLARERLLGLHHKALDTYAAAHGRYVQAESELTAIMRRISRLQAAGEGETAEAKRAHDKARIVAENCDELRAKRDIAAVEVERVLFQAQIELDLSINANGLPR